MHELCYGGKRMKECHKIFNGTMQNLLDQKEVTIDSILSKLKAVFDETCNRTMSGFFWKKNLCWKIGQLVQSSEASFI